MRTRDCNDGNVVLLQPHETPNRKLDLRHLLETDRMRLPDDPVEAYEQLLREMGWLVRMIKSGGEAT